jgi:uncharacterized membrane protein YeaQ/YmgE (transglycosylase-associated protein family)
MLLLAILALGMLAGWLANLVLGGGMWPHDWGEIFAAGIIGSFVGGMLLSLLFGDGLSLRPSGIIGSFLGAIVVLLVWRWVRGRTS